MADKNSSVPPKSANYYPNLAVSQIKDPSKFYAIPLLGGFVKIIILIPVFIELAFIAVAVWILSIVNSLNVLINGKYWQTSFNLTLGMMKLGAKVYLYFMGLTNKYPGFSLDTNDDFSIDIEMPKNPSRFYAIPILGLLVRFILMIPYSIYSSVLHYGAHIGAVISSFAVLANGKYPESTFEFERDSLRVNLASGAYFAGFSDAYPSFWISMNHQTAKLLLIIAGAVMMFSNWGSHGRSNYYRRSDIPKPYQQHIPQNNVPGQLQ